MKTQHDSTKHWAFQPVSARRYPKSRIAKHEIRSAIDAFVLQRLNESKGLSTRAAGGQANADSPRLLRSRSASRRPRRRSRRSRTTTDPKAWDKVIDKLLASPQYGERWGRYWLDLARYADTKGYVFNEDRSFPFAYTYRDYVIRSFNEDKPYDQFIIEQLAADKLPLGNDKRPLAALGFLTLGRRFLATTAGHHRRPDRRGHPRTDGADGLRAPAATITSSIRSRRRTTTRSTACSPAARSRRNCR